MGQIAALKGTHHHRQFLLELGYGLVAAVLTVIFLRNGWSAFDDGYYAWVARRLVEGATLHRDVISNHPGYAHYLHAGLFFVFGEQLSVLRLPHPLIAWVLVTSIARMARSAGAASQGICALCAAALGIIQWNTPSAGWFSVALGAASIAAFCKAHTAPGKYRTWLLVSGILLGLCGGFRQHNGVLLAAGLVVLHIGLTGYRVNPQTAPRWHQGLSFGSLLLALFFIVLPVILSPNISTLLVLLPAIMCVVYATKQWFENTAARSIEWMPPIITGCAIGFLPVALIPAINGALPEFFSNTITGARGFVHVSELTGTSFSLVLGDALELFAKRNVYAWANALYLTTIGVLPLILAMLMHLRQGKIRDPFGAGLLVLAAISLPISAIFQSVLYAYYWLPAVTASVIVLAAENSRRTSRFLLPVSILMPVFALIFHAGRIPGGNPGDIMSKPLELQVACTLPHCDLMVSPQLLNEVSENYRDIISNVPGTRPLLILADGVSLYPFLQNPTPWRLGYVLTGLTPDQEIDRIADQISKTPGTVVLVSQIYTKESRQTTSIDRLVHPLCEVGQTPYYRRYESCANQSQ